MRPSGESYRYKLAKGEANDGGHEALNNFLKSTLGYLIFQEQIMGFLTDFCDHTGAESDSVRRGLAKKVGTSQFLPKIREGFIGNMVKHYGETEEEAEKILKGFLKVIEDASDYGFSVNHSQPYSYIGYIGAYLRYHYPLEFLTVILNLNEKDKDKTGRIITYANKHNVEIKPVTFGKSRALYSPNKEEMNIYKGVTSIKNLNSKVGEELYELSKNNYDKNDFVSLLIDVFETSTNTSQMNILIRLGYFREFGDKEVLLEIYNTMANNKKPNYELYPEFADKEVTEEKVNKRTKEVTYTTKTIKTPLTYKSTLKENNREIRISNLRTYEKAVRANPPKKIDIYDQISFEKDHLGYAISTFDVSKKLCLVTDIIKKGKGKPKIILYQLCSGEEFMYKADKKKFYINDFDQMLYKGDVIQVIETSEQFGWKNENGKWVRNKEVIEPHLEQVKIVRRRKQPNNQQVV